MEMEVLLTHAHGSVHLEALYPVPLRAVRVLSVVQRAQCRNTLQIAVSGSIQAHALPAQPVLIISTMKDVVGQPGYFLRLGMRGRVLHVQIAAQGSIALSVVGLVMVSVKYA